jgi:hypothetical protein
MISLAIFRRLLWTALTLAMVALFISAASHAR